MLRILGRANSSNVQKVLWCCAELGLPFQREDYGGPFGKNREPPYLALNPNGLVPTVVDGDLVIWESNTILRYLAAKNSSETLYPSRPGPRSHCDRWLDWQLSVIGPPAGAVFLALVRTPEEQRDAKALQANRDKLAAAMAILDAQLAKTPFVAADRFTVADIPLGIIAYRWFELPIQREEFPNVQAWYERVAAREGFRKYVATGLS